MLHLAVVAQLVERWIVVPNVAGSSPVDRPIFSSFMSFIEAFLLSLLQGLAEFLPISSSGHLKLAETLLGLHDLDKLLFFDLICHAGTLGSILLVLRRELWQALHNRQELLMIIIAIIPLFPLVFAVKAIKDVYAHPHLLGYFFLATSVILFIGEHFSKKRLPPGKLSALLIGLAQGLALLPGISRSGSTISMARFLGWERVKAAKFSFLLAIPTIMGGIVLESSKLLTKQESTPDLPLFIYIVGFVISFVVGSFMLRSVLIFFKRVSLKPFAVYCAAVGVIALIVT